MNLSVLKQRFMPILTGSLSALLYALAFPPAGLAESAYIFAIPFILWAFTRPGWRVYLVTALLSQWIAWAFLLVWLRNVPAAAGIPAPLVLGSFLVLTLSFLVSLFGTAWLGALRWGLPRWMGLPLGDRLIGMMALAGLWVVLEWVRSWFIFGFPWLPLSASQWQRPVVLQVAAWTGAYGVSFLLILVNLGVGIYLWKIFTVKRGTKWIQRLCPDFYVALGFLFGAIILFFEVLPKSGQFVPMFQAGVVQPNIPQRTKWSNEEARRNLEILERQSFLVNALDPDVLLWPESATPLPVRGDYNLGGWIASQVEEWGTPLLMGNLAEESGDVWYNGIFGVDPESGVVDTYYRKRKLVPFGEYVPLRRIFPFIGKFVPLEGDFQPGDQANLIPLEINNKNYAVGGLVCYEDIFPGLARSLAKAGAEFFFVATNNGWYGPEAAAYQQASHSVLRAVETRRPVIRCGNDGWSGYIDERGQIRHVVTDVSGNIYFRGGAVLNVFRDRIYNRTTSFYVRFGDWFVALSALLAALGYFLNRGRDEGSPRVREGEALPQVGITVRRLRKPSSPDLEN